MFVRLQGSPKQSTELSLLKLPAVRRDRNSSTRLVNFLSSNNSFEGLLKKSQEAKSASRLLREKSVRMAGDLRLAVPKEIPREGLGPPLSPKDKRPSRVVKVQRKSWRDGPPPALPSNLASVLESPTASRRSSAATNKPTTQPNTASALQLSFNVPIPAMTVSVQPAVANCHSALALPERQLPTIHRPQPNHRPPEPQLRLRRIKPAFQNCCWAFCL